MLFLISGPSRNKYGSNRLVDLPKVELAYLSLVRECQDSVASLCMDKNAGRMGGELCSSSVLGIQGIG